ncbi:hypothetical protein J8C07_12980 [Chloracidobacterium sp. S]|nr:hypothetical protein J8C07_12980 [Chloracidobacterium sp. S]
MVNGVPCIDVPTAEGQGTFAQDEGRVEFDCAGLSFLIPDRVRFRFRLEGYDANWVDVGDRRTAFYTNLSAGRYVFRVQACNNDDVWNEVGAAYSFYLYPPLWRRWWMLTLYGLVVVGAVYGGVRWRLGFWSGAPRSSKRLSKRGRRRSSGNAMRSPCSRRRCSTASVTPSAFSVPC